MLQVNFRPSRHLISDQLMRFVKLFLHKLCDSDGSEVHIEIALREALANAVIHGNRENPHKQAYVTCRCSMDGEVSIVVRDDGQGFDSRALLGPVDPSNTSLTRGWGIYLMRALMGEVRFEENGKVVLMRKAVWERVRKPTTPSFSRTVICNWTKHAFAIP